jgi:Transposase IS116/IS110/IS902 family
MGKCRLQQSVYQSDQLTAAQLLLGKWCPSRAVLPDAVFGEAYRVLSSDLTSQQKETLEGLLEARGESRQTWLGWLRQAIGAPNPNNILACIERLKFVRQLGIPTEWARRIHQNRLTGLTLMTELGNDLRAFKTEHHFASWLCLCPGNETSAGKVLRRRTRRSQNRVRQALRMAASSLHRDKSYLGEKYRRFRTRLGGPKAIVAMAHQLARIIWTLVGRQVAFDPSVFAHQEKLNEQRRLKRLKASALQMGYQLAPIAA